MTVDKKSIVYYLHNSAYYITTIEELHSYILNDCEYKTSEDNNTTTLISDVFTLTFNPNRDIEWSRINEIYTAETNSECVLMIPKTGKSLTINSSSEVIVTNRMFTREALRVKQYSLDGVAPLGIESVAKIGSIDDLPTKSKPFSSIVSIQMQMYGYYICKSVYDKKSKGVAFNTRGGKRFRRCFDEAILTPLATIKGGSIVRSSAKNTIRTCGDWWEKQKDLFPIEREIPQWVFELPVEYRLYVLRGIYTGCGISSSHNVTMWSYGDKFREQLRRLFLSVGIVSTIYVDKNKHKNLMLDRPISSWFKDNIGSFDPEKNYTLPRVTTRRKFMKPIESTEILQEEMRVLYGLKVDKNNNYYANGILVKGVSDE